MSYSGDFQPSLTLSSISKRTVRENVHVQLLFFSVTLLAS